ncbi:MAG: phage tail protein [Alphaproteobacteria bacterium]|nr:phage tail protein [Alphaproteobacteria bacterium]
MILGNFQFSLKTLSPQTLSRKTEYNWPDSERIGDLPNLQNLGISKDQIEIEGVFYPKLHGDVSWSNITSSLGKNTISYTSIADIRSSDLCRMANNLINDNGEILGRFVIVSISETQSYFDKNGVPQKIEFTLTLKRSSGNTNATIDLGNETSIVDSLTNLARSYLRW